MADAPPPRRAVTWPSELAAACPACRAGLTLDDRDVACPGCGLAIERREGIWRMLTPEAEARLARFVGDYRAIRAAEGRGGDDDEWYRALPVTAPQDAHAAEWRLRAKSCATFLARVLRPFEQREGRTLRVADVGAGLGWLSNRLAERGHVVAAVDVSDDGRDGLGAWPRYASRWVPVQAEFDRLPFQGGSLDLVVFNASLHYSVDVAATLGEALRTLRPGGRVAIVDTPHYRDPETGRRMLAERAEAFERRYGRRSDSLPVEGSLTDGRLRDLEGSLGVRWSRVMPWYGIGWWLRPWRARLRGHREPARFPIVFADKPSPERP